MTVFENCTVVVDVKNVPYKEKKKLKLALLDNGGNISYVINREVRSAHHYFLKNYYMIVFLIKTKSSYTNDCFSNSWVSYDADTVYKHLICLKLTKGNFMLFLTTVTCELCFMIYNA